MVLSMKKTDVRDGSFTPVWLIDGEVIPSDDPRQHQFPLDFFRMVMTKGDANHDCSYRVVQKPGEMGAWFEPIKNA